MMAIATGDASEITIAKSNALCSTQDEDAKYMPFSGEIIEDESSFQPADSRAVSHYKFGCGMMLPPKPVRPRTALEFCRGMGCISHALLLLLPWCDATNDRVTNQHEQCACQE
ncbi:hypothetical protein [Bradyrhizobium sp. CCGUVB23]|uniref:hypothetical protein n=1 Tax=Bradyrhizobium sp. CCGUVB23 TaxID=2949630 RepID=UPI0020B220A9|nr:hypothetical protein [Bradyrhizobium sp. CCGUVB23]MCP3460388.1 hypothetical protein [Bradyrhizobium sp. CCGUVB23]